MVVWDIMGYEGRSVGKTSIQTEQIPGEKVQEIETAKFETRVMNKIGVQINVNLRRYFLGTSLITLSPLLAWRRSYDKQNLTLVVILYEIYETHRRLVIFYSPSFAGMTAWNTNAERYSDCGHYFEHMKISFYHLTSLLFSG